MVLTRLLVLLLALCAVPARAIEPFIIKDIRVEGIQRTEAGTVFSYLPVKVGDTVSYYTETRSIGRTSITIHVIVTAERGIDHREIVKVTEAEVIMVAVDKDGKSIPIKKENSKR